ncbi:MAG: MFS transporter [Treponemataceae bacterium]|nr:MFS transporter [Treponemataceae bacterium]
MLDKYKYTSSGRFKAALVIFSFMGQVAWVVENMYFNVFIYKMFSASASDISLMVAASAVTAAVTTLFIGCLSDIVKKRRLFICLGYILWGFSILAFAFIKPEYLYSFTGSVTAAASLGVSLVIIMDCVMTFFGSSANDACFNAWLTDCGSDGNRGAIEGINSMMPLVAILAVFGGFMAFNLDESSSWTWIYCIIGGAVILIGISGFFIVEDHITEGKEGKRSWMASVIYSFRPSVIKQNKLLYYIAAAFAVFGIAIQIFMPYLILYYEKSLGMANYVFIMAPAIIVAAVATAFYGRVYDMLGFQKSVIPSVLVMMIGFACLFFFTNTVGVFIGSLLMLSGYLTGMAVFGAMLRDQIPEDKSGLFQGIRIIAMVLIPGIIGPAIGAFVLRDAELIPNSDGTVSFLPNRNIFAAAFIAGLVLLLVLAFIFKLMRSAHRKLSSSSASDWKEYPRPQMRRSSFFCLNGEWKCNGQTISVPFPPQSEFSGFKGKVPSELVYEKTVELPEAFAQGRLLLHFGAVDQTAEVFVDGRRFGSHAGGYLPFTFDVTDAFVGDTSGKKHTIRVFVKDTLSHLYPYGKQKKKRGGMWYTPVSGIWQTVWMEAVPESYISSIKIEPDLTGFTLRAECLTTKGASEKASASDSASDREPVAASTEGPALDGASNRGAEAASDQTLTITIPCGSAGKADFGEARGAEAITVSGKPGTDIRVDLPEHEFDLWTPDNPVLYPFTVKYGEDRVESYFALRTIGIKEFSGAERICLNGKPVFLNAVLDQGYYPEGIYLPGQPSAYARDILAMKKLGFNALRKHIKVEPEVFYYECDRLGMLVMQDMVNNGPYSFIKDTVLPTVGSKKRSSVCGEKLPDSVNSYAKKPSREKIFVEHTEKTIKHLYNHPCIVYYTIFNEGWGQFAAGGMYQFVKKIDSSRIIDTASGWFKGCESDVQSEHIYFKTPDLLPMMEGKKPFVLSECGGYAYEAEGHVWSLFSKYGYGAFKDKASLTEAIVALYEKMVIPAIKKGASGCVYTQLSDVEDEINGFYSYDRAVCKVDEKALAQVAERIYDITASL